MHPEEDEPAKKSDKVPTKKQKENHESTVAWKPWEEIISRIKELSVKGYSGTK